MVADEARDGSTTGGESITIAEKLASRGLSLAHAAAIQKIMDNLTDAEAAAQWGALRAGWDPRPLLEEDQAALEGTDRVAGACGHDPIFDGTAPVPALRQAALDHTLIISTDVRTPQP